MNVSPLKIQHVLYSAISVMVLAQTAIGQSKFELRNLHSPFVDAPVYDAEGIPLAGSVYRAELWGGAAPDDLTPLVLIDHGFSRDLAPFSTGGYFHSVSSFDNLCVLSVPPGGFAWLQVRAWDTRLGAMWEDVAALGMGGYGESSIFYTRGRDPFAEPPQSPGPLIGLQSFSLRPVPEPSTWIMVALGLTSIWLFARRKSR